MHKINIQPDKKENKIVREFNFKTRQYFEHRDYWNKCNKKKDYRQKKTIITRNQLCQDL